MRWWETDQYVALSECDETIKADNGVVATRNGGNVTLGPWAVAAPGSDWEPGAFGLYRDRDGDIWEKEARGWRLRLQDGVEVDPDTVWKWAEGPVREYAPFTRWY
ncbi:hypothetical protein [Nocardia sp. NPDC050406]|uniref:hypothetical protein n=1 Tax=Nocardia sp. NPDC050406 TaxID=3364318 RepID=UPI0037AEC4B9